MNLFEAVKQEVSVMEAAEMYGLEPNQNGMVRCIYHPDKHPSMKLNDQYFFCFGCGATGDVIDLTARLFGLSPLEAARKLAADFMVEPEYLPDAPPPGLWEKTLREKEQRCFRAWRDYLFMLRDWKEQEQPVDEEAGFSTRFVIACKLEPMVEDLLDTFLQRTESDRQGVAVSMDAAIPDLEKQVQQWKEEKLEKERSNA